MSKSEHPISLRVNDEDIAMIEYLKKRLGVGLSGVIRQALRKLYRAEKRQEQ